MGTWGAKLYENDTARDVRGLWKEKLQAGASAEEATAELCEQWGGDDDPVFWLALADQQWTWGGLIAEVQARALRVLDEGGDLALWTEQPGRDQRARVLRTLEKRLRSPPPQAKTVRVRNTDAVAWAPGQLWCYRMLDGQYATFRVAAIDPSYGMTPAPIAELLDVIAEDPPAAAEVRAAGLRRVRGAVPAAIADEHKASPMFQIKVTRRGELPVTRLKKLRGTSSPRPATAETKTIGVRWDNFDSLLVNRFGVGCWMPGTVLSYPLPDGGAGLFEIDTIGWDQTMPEPARFQLGLLDVRGDWNVISADAIAGARRVATKIVWGFPPRELLRVVGARPAQHVEVMAAAYLNWEALPRLFERQR
jgi:hypothetical protein